MIDVHKLKQIWELPRLIISVLILLPSIGCPLIHQYSASLLLCAAAASVRLLLARWLNSLTPLLPQHVTFPGWMMHWRACKQYIFRSYKIYFQCYAFSWKSFHMPAGKRRQKGLRVSNFVLLWVVFKWYHGSEGVKAHSALFLIFFILVFPLCTRTRLVGSSDVFYLMLLPCEVRSSNTLTSFKSVSYTHLRAHETA